MNYQQKKFEKGGCNMTNLIFCKLAIMAKVRLFGASVTVCVQPPVKA